MISSRRSRRKRNAHIVLLLLTLHNIITEKNQIDMHTKLEVIKHLQQYTYITFHSNVKMYSHCDCIIIHSATFILFWIEVPCLFLHTAILVRLTSSIACVRGIDCSCCLYHHLVVPYLFWNEVSYPLQSCFVAMAPSWDVMLYIQTPMQMFTVLLSVIEGFAVSRNCPTQL